MDEIEVAPPPRRKLFVFISIILLAVVGVAVAATLIIRFRPRPQSPPTPVSSVPMPVVSQEFASFKEEPSLVQPAIPSTPVVVSELSNLNAVAKNAGIVIDQPKKDALAQQGFFLSPISLRFNSDPETDWSTRFNSRIDDMADTYADIGGGGITDRGPQNTVFVTSDWLLHTYHVLIDRTWQRIEELQFHPKLLQLTRQLHADAVNKFQSSTDSEMKKAWEEISAYYLVPLAILETGRPLTSDYFGGTPEDQARLEAVESDDQSADSQVNVLAALEKYKASPGWELAKLETKNVLEATGSLGRDDYTQYKPRGHYTKNSLLRTYFRAMMWYGRYSFKSNDPDKNRQAILIADQIRRQPEASALWESIYGPTTFFVGKSDDLTWKDYSSLIGEIFGEKLEITGDKLVLFAEAVRKLPGPKILSEIIIIEPDSVTKEELLGSTRSFRLMGQRFIPDSYIFTRLTQGAEKPDPETGQKLPGTPTALMAMAAFGSSAADRLLESWIQVQAPQSDKVIPKVLNQLKTEVAKVDEKGWTQNLYWSWLYTLRSLWDKPGPGYPHFMQTPAWEDKSLLASLGSWTQLRHDTLLYAKQSYAELGGGPNETPPPVPKGYVEPNLKFLNRLAALNHMTTAGLKTAGVLPAEAEDRFQRFGKVLEFLQQIVKQQLTNAVITETDFEQLRTVGGWVGGLLTPFDGDIIREKDARMGIIADVHTDASALPVKVLYEAVGKPVGIFVAVKDANGTRLARGAVYSYYEFSRPLDSRLTDADWQAAVYGGRGEIPPQPGWVKQLYR